MKRILISIIIILFLVGCSSEIPTKTNEATQSDSLDACQTKITIQDSNISGTSIVGPITIFGVLDKSDYPLDYKLNYTLLFSWNSDGKRIYYENHTGKYLVEMAFNCEQFDSNYVPSCEGFNINNTCETGYQEFCREIIEPIYVRGDEE